MVLGSFDTDPKKGVLSLYVDSRVSVVTEEAKQWVAVTVLVFRGDRVLAMQRASSSAAGAGIWEGISGRVEADEDPLAAAKREVVEESGLRVRVRARPVDTYAARRRGEPMTVIVFRAEHEDGEVVLSVEHDAYRWCALEELTELGVPARLIEAAHRARKVV
jgi:8-oxo-dGTP diphosphatase